MIRIKLGKWYQGAVSNHLYLPLDVKFGAKDEVKGIKCAFYLDLKYKGTDYLEGEQLKALKPLKKNKITFLCPLTHKEWLRMNYLLKSTK